MTEATQYYVILFQSVNQTMWAESVLKKAGVPYKLIPVPRNISSDCGVCLRVKAEMIEQAKNALSGIVECSDIVEYAPH